MVLYIGGSVHSGIQPDWVTSLHVLVVTLFVYTLHRRISARKMIVDKLDRYNYILDHPTYTKYVLLLSGLTGTVTFFFLKYDTQIALIFSGIISLGYILPLVFRKRLRDIGMAKIFLISTVWAVLPILSSITSQSLIVNVYFFAEHYFFIFALTIPFDIRDRALDERAQVSNMANKIGSVNIRKLHDSALILSVLIACLLFNIGAYQVKHLIAMMAFYIILFLVTKDLYKPRKEWYYLVFLDGFIFLKGLIYIVLGLDFTYVL